MATHSVAEEDFRRRARRRLLGAVALTILAVIILPQVLDKNPPPAGKLDIQMPPPQVQAKPVSSGSAQPVQPGKNGTGAETKAEEPHLVATPSSAEKQSAPPPSSSAAVEDRGGYSVQVGAFSTPAYVSQNISRVKSLGLPVYTDKLGNATRVRVGPFKDKSEAEKAAARLKAAGLPSKLDGP